MPDELSLKQIMQRMMGYNIVAFLNQFVTSAAFPGERSTQHTGSRLMRLQATTEPTWKQIQSVRAHSSCGICRPHLCHLLAMESCACGPMPLKHENGPPVWCATSLSLLLLRHNARHQEED